MRIRSATVPLWPLGMVLLLVTAVGVAVIRGVVEAVLFAAVVGLLVGAYLLRRRARARLIYDHAADDRRGGPGANTGRTQRL